MQSPGLPAERRASGSLTRALRDTIPPRLAGAAVPVATEGNPAPTRRPRLPGGLRGLRRAYGAGVR